MEDGGALREVEVVPTKSVKKLADNSAKSVQLQLTDNNKVVNNAVPQGDNIKSFLKMEKNMFV